MNIEEFRSIFEKCLKKLFKKDKLLFEIDLKEECINSALLFHLREALPDLVKEDYNFDLEYNKYKEVEKIMDNGRSVRPDILIHKRTIQKFNFLFVEAKKGQLRKGDKAKVNDALKDPYLYQFGVVVSYLPKKNYCFYWLLTTGEEFTNKKRMRLEKW